MQDLNSKFKGDILQRCYNFALSVMELIDTLPNKTTAKVIASQIVRSSSSIGANITEGKCSSSRLEFKKYYQIALKSANETIYWLNLLKGGQLLPIDSAEKLLKENREIASMLAAGVMKLRKN